jgi:Amt family ammonium transporter
VYAAEAAKIDSGDTAWVLVSSALVLMMTAPGLALFYGGLVRRKNVLGTLMHSFILLAMISVQWVLWGYSLAFGPDIGGIIGSFQYVGLATVGQEPGPYADTIPHLAYMIFQGMFAAITPALITGAFAERMKFKTFLLFGLLWATFVYDPLAHWVPWTSLVAPWYISALGSRPSCVLLSWADAVAFPQSIWRHIICPSRSRVPPYSGWAGSGLMLVAP